MQFELFKNSKRFFVISLFIDDSELKKRMKEVESLGSQKNVKLMVQPCPYEGIEFLYRVSADLRGHFMSLDKDIFWEAIELKPGIDSKIVEEISAYHLNYLTGLLEQNAAKVKKAIVGLRKYDSNFVKPLAGE